MDGGAIRSIAEIPANIQAGKRAGERAKQAEEAMWARINAGNWEPEYASQHVQPFQKANSPVARSYLESFLTGSNPAAVQSTRLGAQFDKAAAQMKFNQAYGGWDKLQADQKRASADNSRFAVSPITRPVRDEEKEVSLKYPQFGDLQKAIGRDLTADEAEYLVERWGGGNKMFGKGGPLMGDTKGVMLMAKGPEYIERVLRERP